MADSSSLPDILRHMLTSGAPQHLLVSTATAILRLTTAPSVPEAGAGAGSSEDTAAATAITTEAAEGCVRDSVWGLVEEVLGQALEELGGERGAGEMATAAGEWVGVRGPWWG